MTFAPLPARAAWQHLEARTGFEVVFMQTGGYGYRFEGQTAAVEDGEPWWVHYVVEVSSAWFTHRAVVSVRSSVAVRSLVVESDGDGHWRIDGRREPFLDGCADVDLESSALTNAFPVHRLGLAPGQAADAPAVYLRALDLNVMRLEQHYQRLEDSDEGQRFHYLAPTFDADFVLPYDASGLVLDYPGLARRVL